MSILFEELFVVHDKNPGGKKFDKVDRIICRGQTYDVQMIVDINSELFSPDIGNKIFVGLTSTLHKDGTPCSDTYEPDDTPSYLDDYQYAMSGKIFRITSVGTNKIEVISSFGGLLMSLKGESHILGSIQLDSNIYLLMRYAEDIASI